MGANATTFVPSYTSGEVLTAANLSVTNSGIPVFADSTARTAAFGGTGEKVLAEGQYAYLESDNSTSFWDGSAWVSVGVSPGLVFVGSASPSAVASVSINNCFSATYDNYLVVMRLSRTSAGAVNARYRVSGADASGANYNAQYNFGSGGTAGANNNTGQTSATVIGDAGGADVSFITMSISSPAIATPTILINSGGYASSTVSWTNTAYHSLSTAYDGITFFPAAGTITGSIRVYGYANS
jgi:hypothetical protein